MSKRMRAKAVLPKMYRQHDILLVEVDYIPQTAKRCDSRALRPCPLAGHSHQHDTGAQHYETPAGQEWMLVFRASAELVADGRPPLALPEGRYRVVRQRSYSPQEVANAQD